MLWLCGRIVLTYWWNQCSKCNTNSKCDSYKLQRYYTVPFNITSYCSYGESNQHTHTHTHTNMHTGKYTHAYAYICTTHIQKPLPSRTPLIPSCALGHCELYERYLESETHRADHRHICSLQNTYIYVYTVLCMLQPQQMCKTQTFHSLRHSLLTSACLLSTRFLQYMYICGEWMATDI